MHHPPAHGLLSFTGLMVACLLVQLVTPAPTQAQDQNVTLPQAIEQHDPKRVAQLLNDAVDPNSDEWPVHPLAMAIEQKQVQITQLLLDYGAHLITTSNGRPLLHLALATGQIDILKALLDAGYDPEIADENGRRLMHHAAELGNAEAIKLLLTRLVRTQDADNNGQTPLDIARARGSPQIIKRLESAEKPHVDQPATQQVTTTDQLIAALRSANDGDIIELGEGQFTGPFFIKNKKLTLRGISESKTQLIGGQQTLVVGVMQGADLTLANVAIKPNAPKQAGIIVQKAKLTMLRCTMSQTPDYGLYVSEGDVRVINCGFEKTGKPAIVAFKKSQLWVETSFFHDIKDSAIHVQDGTQLKLDACGFEKIAKTAIVAVRSQSVVGTLLSFTDCKESLIMQGSGELGYVRQSQFNNSGGIYMQDVDQSILMDNTFNASQVGITLRGRSKAPAAIARNRIISPERGGIYLTNTITNRPSGLLSANEILASPKLGVLLDGKIKATLNNNIILTPRMAISIQKGAQATLDGNLLLGDEAAVNFYQTDATQTILRRESLLGSVLAGKQSPRQLPMTRQLRIVIQDNSALGQSAHKVMANVTDTEQIDASVTELQAQWETVTQRIQSLAQVRLLVIDAVEKSIARPFRVYDGRSADFGAVDILPAHITDKTALEERFTQTDDPVIAHLLKAISDPKELPKLLDHPEFADKDPFAFTSDDQPENEPELSLQQKLNLLVNGPVLYNKQAFKDISLSPGIDSLLHMVEPMNQKQRESLQGRSLIRRLNRSLLESVFPNSLTRSGIIASSYDGSLTNVPPGKYWVVDQDDDNRARLVDIPEGQKIQVKFTNPQSLWVTFHVDDQTQTQCLINLRSQAQCMQALADTYQAGYLMHAAGSLLPDLDPKTIDQALGYARSHLAEAMTQPSIPKDMPRDESKKIWTAHYIQGDAIKRIFAAAGTTEDIDLIIQSLPSDGTMFTYDSWAELIALIEARLGTLENGKLKSLLTDESPSLQIAAARNFARHGLFLGNDILRAHLETAESPWEAGAVIPSLFHDPSPKTRKAMANYIRRFKDGYKKTKPQHISWMSDASLYLMTYGNKQELQAVSNALIGIHEARKFAIVSENPLDIAQMLLDHKHNDQALSIAEFLQDRPGYQEYYQILVDKVAVAEAQKSQRFGTGYRTTINTIGIEHAYFRPNAKNVEFCRGFNRAHQLKPSMTSGWGLFGRSPWMILPQFADDYAQIWLNGENWYRQQLEHLPWDTIEQSLKKTGKDQQPPGYEAYRLARQITHKHLEFSKSQFPRQVKHWPYVWSYLEKDKEYGGGLTGIIDLDWRVYGDQLQVYLTINQRSLYNGIGSLAGMIGRNGDKSKWPHHTATLNHGLGLIKSIELRDSQNHKVDLAAPVQMIGSTFVYQTNLPSTGLTDQRIDITLDLPYRTMLITEPLYAGTVARANRLRTLLAKQRWAMLSDAPSIDQLLEVGDAFLDTGDMNTAWAVYEKATQHADASPNTWREIAQRFAVIGRHDTAAGILISAVRLTPDNVRLWTQLVTELYNDEQYEKAIDAATRAMEIDAKHISLRLLRSSCLLMLGNHEQAHADLATLTDPFIQRFTLPLMYIAANEHESLDAKVALAACKSYFDQAQKDQKPTDVGAITDTYHANDYYNQAQDDVLQCRIASLIGHRMLYNNQKDQAFEWFKKATAFTQPMLLEYRLAKKQLKQLAP